MFLRVTSYIRNGKQYRYLRLVESYRDKGKIKQRIIATIGNLDTLGREKIDSLIDGLCKFSKRKILSIKDLVSKKTLHYGSVLVIKKIWDKLKLDQIISSSLRGKNFEFEIEKAAFIMVANRLIKPQSKLSLTRWQKKIYLPKSPGSALKYQHFWRSLDYLAKVKGQIERALFYQLCDLFSLKLNLVFYDITSSYFEGNKCRLAKFGYSRDRRPDKRQILLGLLVTDKGIPIAHDVFEGNIADKTTLTDIVGKLKREFSIKRCIFVCDRGMVSPVNLSYLEKNLYQYIVALRKRRSKEIANLLRRVSDKNYQKISDNLKVLEVKIEQIKYLICHNPQKARDDKIFREALITKTKKALDALSKRVKQKKLKRSKLIITRFSEIVSKYNTKKFFLFSCEGDREFEYKLNDDVLKLEESLDGVYILKSNCLDLSATEIITAYKNLTEVEEAFREIKDFLRLRPIYHYSPDRVRAHIFVCVISYLIEKILLEHLAEKDFKLSARMALEILDDVRLIENQLGNDTIWSVTEIDKEQQTIFDSLGIRNIPRTILS